MFDASLKDRELSFKSAPGTTMFLHWLVGMVYVFYFASFILLLREVSSVPRGSPPPSRPPEGHSFSERERERERERDYLLLLYVIM